MKNQATLGSARHGVTSCNARIVLSAPVYTQSTGEIVHSPPKESEEERGTTHGVDDGVKAAEVEHPDVPIAKESMAEADERIKLARRRRRCPVVDVDRYTRGGAGEMKEGGAGKQR